jgi:CheY-like chemotaxis protein
MSDKRQCHRVLRALVVDDNKEFTELFEMNLLRCGYDVRVAGDGPTALQLAYAHPPDVILTDLSLPAMDGYELAKLLRVQLAPKTPVFIALTGSDQDSDRLRSKDEGFAFHFVKPVEPDFLRLILGDLARNGLRQDKHHDDGSQRARGRRFQ